MSFRFSFLTCCLGTDHLSSLSLVSSLRYTTCSQLVFFPLFTFKYLIDWHFDSSFKFNTVECLFKMHSKTYSVFKLILWKYYVKKLIMYMLYMTGDSHTFLYM